MKSKLVFFRQILLNRQLIITMAHREIKSRFVGSTLGVIWVFMQPLVMIGVFWFVFSVGFRSKPMQDVPFVVWLTAGIAPWFFFSDMVLGATSAILHNANLVKKTLFHPHILPIVKLLSSSFIHIIFLILLVILLIFQDIEVSLWNLQFLYYFVGLSMFVLGFSWLVSAINVFIRDVSQIVNILIQLGFWATPIFWDIKIMPKDIQFFIKLNPMFYIVQGYRDSFISFIPFWYHPYQTIYFWVVTLFLLFFGVAIFQKLRPLFADVL